MSAGVNSPRVTASAQDLPSARLVSTQFATEADISYDNYTLLIMQWGQFLDHDLTHTPINRGKSALQCDFERGYDLTGEMQPRMTSNAPAFDVVLGLVWSHDLASHAGGSVAAGRLSHARRVKGDDRDKKGHPGPAGGPA